jgi:fructokinase
MPTEARPAFDVVSFGEILWDMFAEAPLHSKRSATAAPCLAAPMGVFYPELGGAPANLAVGLAGLGVRAAVVGGVGKDRFGSELRRCLKAAGVDVRFALPLDARTGVAFVFRDTDGEPRFLFYRHDTADMTFSARHVRPSMASARWIVVGSSTLAHPGPRAATRAFVAYGKKKRARLVVDLNVRSHLWAAGAAMERACTDLVKHAELIKASASDLRALGLRSEASLRRLAPEATWLLTRGGGTARAVGPWGHVDLATRRARCADATGAGDAFLAGVLATLVHVERGADSASGGRAAFGPTGGIALDVWTAALRVGHAMGRKAVSSRGSVSAFSDLSKERSLLLRSVPPRFTGRAP